MGRATCIGLVVMAFAGTLRAEPHRKLVPVALRDVQIESEFWTPRVETNTKVTVPHSLKNCASRIRSFAQVAGLDTTPFDGGRPRDSDLYKVLEGASYSLITHPDKELEAQLDHIIDLIARAQQPDGYLNTYFTMAEPEKRWTNLHLWHELYCAGHLLEAAVAHFRATGKRTFLDVARKFADYIDSVFGPGKRYGVPGHEEIELALVKLWRVTREERYLALARFFVDERGQSARRELYGEHRQDHLPVKKQTEPRGHAVCFNYLYSGVADLAALDGDKEHIAVMESLWQNIAKKHMYITGGVGVRGFMEGFTDDYYLPNYKAYCETCASISATFWNQRLLLLHGEARFADMVERLLYNGALAGVSLDGKKFFYVNPLMSRGNHHRLAWHGLSCCPTNVVRFIAALGQYIYGGLADGEGASVLQYVGGSGVVKLKKGSVRIVQETRYPWEGSVRLVVEPQDGAETFTMRARIPDWCTGATVSLNGRRIDPKTADGFLVLRRAWRRGDTIALEFPMPVSRVKSHPDVAANRGRRALQRGPVIYCFEGCDNPDPVDRLAVPEDAVLEAAYEPDLLGGVVVLRGRGKERRYVETADGFRAENRDVDVTAVPYYAWENRAPGGMAVWVRTELPSAEETKSENLAVAAKPSASYCTWRFTPTALNDNLLPESSRDHPTPSFAWPGTRERSGWIAYEFEKPKTLSKTEIYWLYNDSRKRPCRVPESWRILWHDGDSWVPVEATSPYGVAEDEFNAVTFKPVTTRALRVEAQFQPKVFAGVLEWRLPE